MDNEIKQLCAHIRALATVLIAQHTRTQARLSELAALQRRDTPQTAVNTMPHTTAPQGGANR